MRKTHQHREAFRGLIVHNVLKFRDCTDNSVTVPLLFCVCILKWSWLAFDAAAGGKTYMSEKNEEKSEEKSGVLREGIAYLIFGVLTTAIDYVISNVLYYRGGMASVPAQTIAWVAAVLFAFVTNKWWVFKSHTLNPVKVWKEFVSFVVCRIVTFLFNLAALAVMVDFLGLEFFLCKLVISVAVVVLNYVFSKILIFAKKNEK